MTTSVAITLLILGIVPVIWVAALMAVASFGGPRISPPWLVACIVLSYFVTSASFGLLNLWTDHVVRFKTESLVLILGIAMLASIMVTTGRIPAP